MRSARLLIFALAFVGAFYWFTNSRHAPEIVRHAAWVTAPQQLPKTQAATPESLDAEERNNIDVYRRVVPAVVNITSRATTFDFFYGAVPQEGQGSGFILDKEGHILTNYHVVAGAQQLEVTLHDNKRKYRDVAVIGTDRAHDLALLQVRGDNLPMVALGDSRNLLVGQKVYAIGNPFGLAGTMSRGIISSLRPVQTPTGANIDDAIQTDAAINPGNSGGPLLNVHGEVIGINTMIATGGANQSSGIGFAIPINAAKAFVDDIRTYGHVRRPSLGIRSIPIGPELAQEIGLPADYGVLIVQVAPGSAAERAGLKGGSKRAYLGNTPILLGGDLIVGIDGEEIADQRDLAAAMNRHRAGDTVTVTVYRGKQRMDVKVTLGEAQGQA